MGSALGLPEFVSIDTTLTLVLTDEDGTPNAVHAKLTSLEPAMLAIEGEAGEITVGQRVLLLAQSGAKFSKTVTEVISCARHANSTVVGVATEAWSAPERRSNTRKRVRIPITLSTVLMRGAVEIDWGGNSEVSNLSEVGAWVRTDQALPKGSLVQWKLNLDENELKGLALVIRGGQSESGMGLKFVSLNGDAPTLLSEFLQRQ